MSPKRRVPPDAFDDENTTNVFSPGVPIAVEDDGDATVPVDVDDMELAAKRSRLVPDPKDPPRFVRRSSSRGEGSGPYAEVSVAGSAAVVELPARGVSPSGVALEIPPGAALALQEGVTVMIRLHMDDGEVAPDAPRLRANVVHRREGKDGAAGGVSMRWDTEHEPTQRELTRLLG